MKLNQLFHNKFDETYMSLKIFDLCTYIYLHEPNLVNDHRALKKAYHSLFNSIWKASIIFDKVAFNLCLLKTKQLVNFQYSGFVRTDIEHFHTIVRSSMDYIVEIISLTTNVKIKNYSFSVFRNNIEDYKNNLDEDICQLIKDANWYPKFTKYRNKLVHSGAETLVFFGNESNNNTKFEIDMNDGQQGENFIFEEYAVKYYSNYLYFLHTLGVLLESKLKPSSAPTHFMINGQGLKVLYNWANDIETYKPR